MKKIILGVVVVLLLGLALMAFFVVRSFNADTYTEQVKKSLEQMTGRSVEIKGQTTLSWTPLPTFEIHDVQVANQEGGSEPVMMKIEQIQVEMEWLSFFKSPLVIKKIVLKKPDILIERKYSYQTNFSFPVLFNPNRNIESDSLIVSPSDFLVRIDSLDVESGVIRWKNLLTQQELTLTDINGTGKIDSFDGPYSFDGHLKLLDQKLDVTVKTDKVMISTPLRITTELKSAQTVLKMSSDLNFDAKDKWLTIKGTFESENPYQFMKSLGVENWLAEGHISGSYTWEVLPDKNIVSKVLFIQRKADETLLSLGGGFSQDFATKQNNLTLEAEQVDLLKYQDLLDKFLQQPSGQKTEIVATAKQVSLNTIKGKNAQFNGTLEAGSLKGQLNISLENESSVLLKGTYRVKDKNLNADLSFGTTDLLALLHNSFPEIKDLFPKQNLKQFQLSGKMKATPRSIQFDSQSAALDNLKLSGKVEYFFDTKKVKIQLKTQGLDLDKYYDVPEAAGSQIVQALLGQTQLTQPDLVWDLDLNLANLVALKTSLDQFIFKGVWQRETLDVNELTLRESDDNYVSYKGKMTQTGTLSVAFKNADLTGKITDFTFLNRLGFHLPDFLEKANNLQGKIQYDGHLTLGQVDASLESDGAQLSVKGQIKDLFNQPTLTQNDVHFYYPNLTRLFQQIYPEQHLFQNNPITIDFTGKVMVDSKSWQFQDTILYLGDDRLDLNGEINLKPLKIRSDIKATRFNWNLFLPDLMTYVQNQQKTFDFGVDADMSASISILSDLVNYRQHQGKSFKSQFVLENQTLKIKEFSFIPSQQKDALLQMTGEVGFANGLALQTKIQGKGVSVPDKIWSVSPYALGSGSMSGNVNVKGQGKNWQELVTSLDVAGDFSWTGGILDGVDVPIWQEAVYSTLKIGQMSSGFKSRLDEAFKKGNTKLPTLTGRITSKNGEISLTDVTGENQVVSLNGFSFQWSGLTRTTHLNIPFVLVFMKQVPAIVLDVIGTTRMVQSLNYESAFQDEVKIKSRQLFEAQQLQQKKDTEAKNALMQQSAKGILAETDKLLQHLQQRVLINPSYEANNRLKSLTKTAEDIHKLAVREDMTDSDHVTLLEKSKLLSLQAKEFDSWLGVADLLAQKKEVERIPEASQQLMNQMERIYQQNPRSVVMAEMIMNARQTVEKINTFALELEGAEESQKLQELITALQENYLKLQKAGQYMEKLNLSLQGGLIS